MNISSCVFTLRFDLNRVAFLFTTSSKREETDVGVPEMDSVKYQFEDGVCLVDLCHRTVLATINMKHGTIFLPTGPG